jgi:hypothetical protein
MASFNDVTICNDDVIFYNYATIYNDGSIVSEGNN